ncbi:MAG: glutathione S-transferase [Rhodobacteraceae bacterium]|nr:MAG: glutathione S-transferase [Paracoccaceae bacterium]|tara:strand:- start:1462 stop:2151 length:690 start_codon:yes stop_codon:yes gene_type:complete
MNGTTLVIADKNYSLWPLAPWLCMKKVKMPFAEKLIRFGQHDTREKMLEYGPTGRVPVLIHDGLKVWDSLAICEFVNDLYPSENLWPNNLLTRAQARTFAAEMHATGGAFPGAPRHIIYALDTNVRRRTDRVKPKNHLLESINYLITRWQNLIHRFGGSSGFLFDEFTIADAMSAHLVNRFYTYDIKLPDDINDYCENMRKFSPLAQWIREAESEDWTLPSAEIDVSKL